MSNLYKASTCILILMVSCTSTTTKEEQTASTEPSKPKFEKVTIAENVEFLWAHAPGDVTGDGIADLVFVTNNARGGYLGYYEGRLDDSLWMEVVVAETGPEGGTLAQGDLEVGDIDGDGDLDIIGVEHPGEWDASTDDSKVYWYENPSWTPHFIGTTPDFVKDFSIVDLDKDGKADLAALTFESSSLSIFQQNSSDDWTRVQYWENYGNLHEGMHVGDVDGDGWTDIVAEAHVFYNPNGTLGDTWSTDNIDAKWNNQEGDWSRNGTKVFIRNIDDDPEEEVFISHSERPGYPVSVYDRSSSGEWTETMISDSIPACHTLQAFDFDNDGNMDLLSGINRTRGKDLGFDAYDVTIHFSDAQGNWEPFLLHQDGIYNGQVIDYDGDGDLDIFSYQTHDAGVVELMVNN